MILMRYPFRVFWERLNKPSLEKCFFRLVRSMGHFFGCRRLTYLSRSSVDTADLLTRLKAKSLNGYGSIPINTIFRGMNIHKSQLFWCELQGYKVLTHCQMGLSPVSQKSRSRGFFFRCPFFGGKQYLKEDRLSMGWYYIYILYYIYIYVHTCDLILVANHSSEFSDNDNRVLAMVWVVVGNGVVVVSKQILEYGIWNQNMLQANVNK